MCIKIGILKNKGCFRFIGKRENKIRLNRYSNKRRKGVDLLLTTRHPDRYRLAPKSIKGFAL